MTKEYSEITMNRTYKVKRLYTDVEMPHPRMSRRTVALCEDGSLWWLGFSDGNFVWHRLPNVQDVNKEETIKVEEPEAPYYSNDEKPEIKVDETVKGGNREINAQDINQAQEKLNIATPEHLKEYRKMVADYIQNKGIAPPPPIPKEEK